MRKLYRDETAAPVLLTDGQDEIFQAITKKENDRVYVDCYTQYGKSMTTALGVLTRARSFPERWAIVGPTTKKAAIIMSHANFHLFDNEWTSSGFVRQKGETDEDIKRYRNKNHITFKLGPGLFSDVFIGSAKDALGFGAENVILDEAALVDDDEEALVLRMLAGKKDNFYMKIGNPFRRNHFYRASIDPRYRKIHCDVYRGIKEGRFNPKDLAEVQDRAFFGVLYECKFPDASVMDDKGWMLLFLPDDFPMAFARKVEPYGRKRLGIDVARGGRNFNVCYLRGENYARRLWKNKKSDLMEVAQDVVDAIVKERVSPRDVFIDDTGVGGGVTDRVKQLGYEVNGIKEGAAAQGDGIHEESAKAAQQEYENIRAEIYAGIDGLANWVKRVGMIEENKDLVFQAEQVRYRKKSSKRTIIMGKDDMRKDGYESPDDMDALALTFAKPVLPHPYTGAGNGFGGVGPLDAGLGIMA